MTTIAAVANADGVQLTVSPADVTVARLDANGLRPVRRPAGQPLVWTDYEAPLLGTVRYVALDSAGADASTSVVIAGQVLPQLRRVFEPSVVVRPIVARMPATASLTATEHTIIGRPDTIFTTYGFGKRRGTISYACSSYADAVAIRRLYAAGAVALLRFPEYASADLYHIATDRAEDLDPAAPVKSTEGEPTWTTVVTFAEVEPSSLTTISGWLLRDVDSTYPTLASAALAYTTLADMDANRVVAL